MFIDSFATYLTSPKMSPFFYIYNLYNFFRFFTVKHFSCLMLSFFIEDHFFLSLGYHLYSCSLFVCLPNCLMYLFVSLYLYSSLFYEQFVFISIFIHVQISYLTSSKYLWFPLIKKAREAPRAVRPHVSNVPCNA